MSRLPAWLPGAGIKREATRWRPFVEAMMDVPYRKMKETVVGTISLYVEYY